MSKHERAFPFRNVLREHSRAHVDALFITCREEFKIRRATIPREEMPSISLWYIPRI